MSKDLVSCQAPLATVFGTVTATRIAYRAPLSAKLHPMDAALNLPIERASGHQPQSSVQGFVTAVFLG